MDPTNNYPTPSCKFSRRSGSAAELVIASRPHLGATRPRRPSQPREASPCALARSSLTPPSSRSRRSSPRPTGSPWSSAPRARRCAAPVLARILGVFRGGGEAVVLAAALTAIRGGWPPPSRDDRSLDRMEWLRPRITSTGQGRPEEQPERARREGGTDGRRAGDVSAVRRERCRGRDVERQLASPPAIIRTAG